MATITSVGSGLWSAAGTWDSGVPADNDNAVIAAGHIVEFDVDQSGFANGIAGITITGTLKLTRTAGTYYMKLKSGTGISGAGTFDCGTDGDEIPTGTKHTVTGGGTTLINGSGGLTMTVYDAEPTYTTIKLSAAESAGQTVLSVDTDVTGDIWADGDTIRIDNVNQGPQSEERTIAVGGISATEITITAGLTNSKLKNSLVHLVSRNVRIFTSTAHVVLLDFAKSKLTIAGGEYASNGGSCIALGYGTISGGTITASNYGLSDGNFVISGGVISGNSRNINNCTINMSGGVLSGSTYGTINCADSVVSGGTISGCTYAFQNCPNLVASNLEGDGNSRFVSIGACILDTCIVNNSYWSLENVPHALIYNSQFTNGATDIINSIVTAYNTLFGGSTQNSGYASRNVRFYSESVDDGQVQGAYKAWTKGGVTTLQSSVYPMGYDESYQTVLGDADNEGYWQKEITVGAGQLVNFDLWLRKSASMSYLPRCQIFLKRDTDPFAGGTPIYTFTMTDSVDTWENDTYTYSNDGEKVETLVIRFQGKNASGNVFSMYDAEIRNVDLTTVLANLATVDGVVDAIKAVTDQFNFTIANQVDANALTGGTSAVEIREEMDNNSTKLADILTDTGTTLPDILDTIKGAGWTDENLVAIKAAIDAVNEGKITAQEVWEYAARTLTQSATEVVAAVTGSSITQVRGNTWSFEVPGLTLHAHRQQFAIKRSLEDSDDQALLLIDSQSKLVRVMGRAAQDPSGASLSYADTSLTVGAAAEISARLPAGRWKFGIQSIAEDGTVAENKIGDFILEADAVRATE